MAGNLQISIKDNQTAKQWLDAVQIINTDYRTAMDEAGKTLEDVSNFAEGTLVDELYKWGTDICNAAQTTYEAIDKIADTVNTVLDKVASFTEDVVGTIGTAIGKIFGK